MAEKIEWEQTCLKAEKLGVEPSIFWKNQMMEVFLKNLSQNDLNRFFVLQTYSALRFAYGSPRLCFRLNFLVTDKANSLSRVSDLTSLMNKFYDFEVSHFISGDETGRLVFFITFPQDGLRVRFKIKITNKPAIQYKPFSYNSGSLLIETLPAIQADLIASMVNVYSKREFAKPTSLFDLAYAVEKLGSQNIDSSLLKKKCDSYSVKFSKDKFLKFVKWVEENFEKRFQFADQKVLSQVLPKEFRYDGYLSQKIDKLKKLSLPVRI